MIKIDPQIAIDYLNELLAIDANAIDKLIESRVLCNKALSNHPTVQVIVEFEENGEEKHTVGLLGIINGLVGVHDESGWGYVAAEYDGNGKLLKFVQTPKTIDKV